MPPPPSLAGPAGPPTRLSPFGDAIAGALAAAYSNLLVYPLDVVSTRMQLSEREKGVSGALPLEKPGQHTSYGSTFDALRKIFEQEGLKGLYGGLGTSLGASMLNNFAYFYFYSLIRRMYLKANPSPPSTVVELLLGMLAGACARMCTTPVNVITTRQQMRPTLSSYEIFRSILESDGPTGLYAGLPASLVLTVNPAITYGLFERMKTSGYPKGPFARGAVSKAVATVVTYPYIMAKVRLQFKGSKGYRSAWEVLSSIVRENGLFGLYEGLPAQLYKSVLTQAILFVFKDHIEKMLLVVVVAIWTRRHGQAARKLA